MQFGTRFANLFPVPAFWPFPNVEQSFHFTAFSEIVTDDAPAGVLTEELSDFQL